MRPIYVIKTRSPPTHTLLLHLSVKSACHKFLGFVKRCQWLGGWGGLQGHRGHVCVCVFILTYLHALSLCVTVIWWVHVADWVLGVDTVIQLRCHPEKCRPFALWPRAMALEGLVSNHCHWTSAIEVSCCCPGCCHKAKTCRTQPCVCKATVINFFRGKSALLGWWMLL